MNLILLVLVLLVALLACYAVQRYAPGDATAKNIVCLIILILFCLWALAAVGIIGDLTVEAAALPAGRA